MLPERKGPAGKRDLVWFLIAAALPVPWVAAHALGGLGLQHEGIAALSGFAILGAAFLLSWSMELAERDIPQSLALLVLALVSVLPEYAVDLHFAITAASDPTYAPYAIANMTGANRLLIGLGWAAVVLIACRKTGESQLRIDPQHRLEVRFLILATLWSVLIPLDGYLGLFDAAVLLLLFAAYVASAMRGESHDSDLMGPAALVDLEFQDLGRRVWALLFFVYGGYAIWVSAEPFAEGLVHIGRNYAIDEFLLVQWLAPLASESPEFIVAILFALRMRGSLGLGALISSKVNQWTLLVGALPVAFVAAGGGWRGLPLDGRQTEELLLTSAQSLLAALLICNLWFRRVEAVMIAALFAVQLVFPSTEVRIAFAVLYVAIFLGLMIHSPERRHGFLSYLSLRGHRQEGPPGLPES